MNPVLHTVMRVASKLNVAVYRRSGGRRMNRAGGGIPVLLLTTTGRRTGQPRTKPVGYVDTDGSRYVCGSAGGSDQTPAWVQNLRATPEAVVELGERSFPVTATELTDDEYGPVWQVFKERHSNFAAYETKTSRRMEIFRLVEGAPA